MLASLQFPAKPLGILGVALLPNVSSYLEWLWGIKKRYSVYVYLDLILQSTTLIIREIKLQIANQFTLSTLCASSRTKTTAAEPLSPISCVLKLPHITLLPGAAHPPTPYCQFLVCPWHFWDAPSSLAITDWPTCPFLRLAESQMFSVRVMCQRRLSLLQRNWCCLSLYDRVSARWCLIASDCSFTDCKYLQLWHTAAIRAWERLWLWVWTYLSLKDNNCDVINVLYYSRSTDLHYKL